MDSFGSVSEVDHRVVEFDFGADHMAQVSRDSLTGLERPGE